MTNIRVQHSNWSSRIGTTIVVIAFVALAAAPWWAERADLRLLVLRQGDMRLDEQLEGRLHLHVRQHLRLVDRRRMLGDERGPCRRHRSTSCKIRY
jgi:hypothetical protein